jgi:hypothetical protein
MRPSNDSKSSSGKGFRLLSSTFVSQPGFDLRQTTLIRVVQDKGVAFTVWIEASMRDLPSPDRPCLNTSILWHVGQETGSNIIGKSYSRFDVHYLPIQQI